MIKPDPRIFELLLPPRHHRPRQIGQAFRRAACQVPALQLRRHGNMRSSVSDRVFVAADYPTPQAARTSKLKAFIPTSNVEVDAEHSERPDLPGFSKCSPADGTNAAFEIAGLRQAPLAALNSGYISRPPYKRGHDCLFMLIGEEVSSIFVCSARVRKWHRAAPSGGTPKTTASRRT